MPQDNNTYFSLVGGGLNKPFTRQLHTKKIGEGAPVIEASYIAAPKSIYYDNDIESYYWTPLSTYLSKIKNDIIDINNSLIGTLPPTSAEEETSISNTVGINVITNIGVNDNSISYTYTPIKVDFSEIDNSISNLNDKINKIINFIDPPLRLLAIPSEITFSGENYATGVNAYVETNINNTSLVKWESTGTDNVKLNTYFGLNNIITPISYKNTSPDDKIKISINTTYFNGDPKTVETEIPLKYNKTYGGLINISYTVYNEYIYK